MIFLKKFQYFAGLEQRIVHDRKDVMDAVKLGNHNRKMSATAANKVSSRSHAVLQVFVTRTKPAVPGKSCGRIIRGVMNLIDLAAPVKSSFYIGLFEVRVIGASTCFNYNFTSRIRQNSNIVAKAIVCRGHKSFIVLNGANSC